MTGLFVWVLGPEPFRGALDETVFSALTQRLPLAQLRMPRPGLNLPSLALAPSLSPALEVHPDDSAALRGVARATHGAVLRAGDVAYAQHWEALLAAAVGGAAAGVARDVRVDDDGFVREKRRWDQEPGRGLVRAYRRQVPPLVSYLFDLRTVHGRKAFERAAHDGRRAEPWLAASLRPRPATLLPTCEARWTEAEWRSHFPGHPVMRVVEQRLAAVRRRVRDQLSALTPSRQRPPR